MLYNILNRNQIKISRDPMFTNPQNNDELSYEIPIPDAVFNPYPMLPNNFD